MVGDDQAEDGVAQELQPLVGLVTGELGAPRPVRQGAGEELDVDEGTSEPLAKGFRGRTVNQDEDASPTRLTT